MKINKTKFGGFAAWRRRESHECHFIDGCERWRLLWRDDLCFIHNIIDWIGERKTIVSNGGSFDCHRVIQWSTGTYPELETKTFAFVYSNENAREIGFSLTVLCSLLNKQTAPDNSFSMLRSPAFSSGLRLHFVDVCVCRTQISLWVSVWVCPGCNNVSVSQRSSEHISLEFWYERIVWSFV